MDATTGTVTGTRIPRRLPFVAGITVLAAALTLALPMSAAAATAAPIHADVPVPDAAGEGAFHRMVERQTMDWLATEPEMLTILGMADDHPAVVSRQLSDVSLSRRAEIRDALARYRTEIAAVDRDSLVGQERFTHDMASWYYARVTELTGMEWSPGWIPLGNIYAVDQLFSIPIQLPQFMETHHQVNSEASARDYIARLEAIATKLDQVGENLDMQASHGVVPPAVALEGAANQMRALIEPASVESPFVRALQRKLDPLEMGPALQEELLAEAIRAVGSHTNPGYERLLAKVEAALATAPGNNGAWSLPDGDAFYDATLRWNTSTDLDAGEIHRMGLEEVARIEREMDALLQSQGYINGSVAERINALVDIPELNYPDTEAGRTELLADIDRVLAELDPHLDRYFSRLPEQALEVTRVPAHAEENAPGGYYYPPALDGSRPGTFFINLGDMEGNTRWNIPTLVYHEGAPGHHFQISLGQTIEDLPFLRRSLNPSAFTEGWALYAEELVNEMGLYDDDPMGDLGRLQAEMFRAVRLVVDTGLHRNRWSMERAMEYMADQTGMSPAQVRTEIHRYLVQPGQATSYKVGHLKMTEIREDAREQLGEDFDIRAFHDLVLGNGALPLSVLAMVVDEWAEERTAVQAP